MDGAVPCPSPAGHDYLPDQPPVRHGSTATATCGYCGHTITATRPVPGRRPATARASPADGSGRGVARGAAAPSGPSTPHGTW
ncbi:hypothetical protein [Nocardiopsis sp. YSL2]|uniref:hypothetical protein n=1 Tax=Nocardiopsis sp. YSL2 TaxID=2939492 RepID=UPI0026F43336|nr:hypothetical protein [Nocardiopsis sp. YSL2]